MDGQSISDLRTLLGFLSHSSNSKIIHPFYNYYMRGDSNWVSLLRSMRIERSLIPISYALIPPAIVGEINLDIFLLLLCTALMYSVGGVYNAKRDHDYSSTKFNIFIIFLVSISIAFSLFNKIILIAIFLSTIFSFIYSKYSRKLIFGDGFILPFTHVAIPFIASAFILEMDILSLIPLIVLLMFTLGILSQMKNLQGSKKDKKRGYKTLLTVFREGDVATFLLMNFAFLLLYGMYFVFNFSDNYLIGLVGLFILQIFMSTLMYSRKNLEAYGLTRLTLICIALLLVFETTENILFVAFNLMTACCYLVYCVTKFKVSCRYGI